MKTDSQDAALGTYVDWSLEPDLPELQRSFSLLGQNPAAALPQLQSLASRGSVMSLIYLGSAFKGGLFGYKDLVEAEKLYGLAAQRGSIVGAYLLGRLEYDRKDYARALVRFKTAAAKQFPPAMHILGVMYWTGKGTEVDQRAAEEVLRRGAEMGNAHSKGLLGRVLIQRKTSWRDTVTGLQLFISATATLLLRATRGLFTADSGPGKRGPA